VNLAGILARFCLTSTLSVVISTHALGQAPIEFTVSEARISFVTTEHNISIPKPLWAQSSRTAGSFKRATSISVLQPNAQTALIEFIPYDETFDTWTQMSGVLVVNDPDFPVSAHEASIAHAFETNCKKGALMLERVPPLEAGFLPSLMAVCAEFRTDGVATGIGLGEVLIAIVLDSPNGAAKIFEEWRGPTFDLLNKRTWPIGEHELLTRMVRMQGQISFTKLKQ